MWPLWLPDSMQGQFKFIICLAFLKHIISFAWPLEELNLSSFTLYPRYLQKRYSRGDGAHIVEEETPQNSDWYLGILFYYYYFFFSSSCNDFLNHLLCITSQLLQEAASSYGCDGVFNSRLKSLKALMVSRNM